MRDQRNEVQLPGFWLSLQNEWWGGLTRQGKQLGGDCVWRDQV